MFEIGHVNKAGDWDGAYWYEDKKDAEAKMAELVAGIPDVTWEIRVKS